MAHPSFAWQAVLLSITSATGQLFIFRTLSVYGTLVFAIIMTYVLSLCTVDSHAMLHTVLDKSSASSSPL